MTATELIKQVAALPPREKVLFQHLFNALEMRNCAAQPSSDSQWPVFGERLRNIYSEKVTPDSQKIIDEGRDER